MNVLCMFVYFKLNLKRDKKYKKIKTKCQQFFNNTGELSYSYSENRFIIFSVCLCLLR